MPSNTAIFTIESKCGEMSQFHILSCVFFMGLCLCIITGNNADKAFINFIQDSKGFMKAHQMKKVCKHFFPFCCKYEKNHESPDFGIFNLF